MGTWFCYGNGEKFIESRVTSDDYIRSGKMITNQLHKYKIYLYFFFRILINLCVSLCPLWLKSAQKMLQKCHKSKTNPNEPNCLEDKTDSKPKNEDFRQIYENLFMQNEPNGMLFKTQ